VHDLDEAEKHCVACAQDLRAFGEEVRERYEYIPAQRIVIEDVCKKYSCTCTVRRRASRRSPLRRARRAKHF
jgi:transposase